MFNKIDKLKSKEFVEFLNIRLKEATEHQFVNQQRILLPCDYYEYSDFDEYPETFKNNKKSKILVGYEYVNNEMRKVYQKIDYGFATNYKDNIYSKNSAYDERIGSSPYFYHDGIIAGGAVAALANEFLFGIPAIINDIDYFYFSNFKFSTEQAVYEDIYENLSERDVGFSIKKSTKEGLLNFIKIELPDNKKIWDQLISYFDLNCCKIGFHPLSKKVIISESFKQFIDDRRIEHVNNELNVSNLVRAKRKSLELDAKYYFGDAVRNLILKDIKHSSHTDEWEMTAYVVENKPIPLISKNKRSTRFISQKDLLELDKNPNLLLPYFKFNKEQKNLRYHGNIPLVNFYQRYIFKKGSWKKYKNSKETNWFIISNLMKEINPKYPVEEISEKYYNRLLILINGLSIIGTTIASQEYDYDSFKFYKPFLTQEIDENKFFDLIERLDGHENCVKIIFNLLHLNWSFAKIDFLFRRIENKPKEYYGILQDMFKSFSKNKEHSIVKVVNKEVYINLKQHPNSIIEKMDEINQLILDSKNIFLREKVYLKLFKEYANELVSGKELTEEGHKMKHCVGGRFTSVAKQNCRIFHIKFKKVETTLELIWQNDIWVVGEHKGFGNQFPSKNLKNFAKIFCNYINLYNL